MSDFSPLSGEERKSDFEDVRAAFVEGFGCRPIAALRLGPRPASESRQGRNPREMSGGGAASAALWIFVYDGSACWQPTLMSVLADDVAAHDGSVAGR